jgi:hypothetical protein
MTVAQINQVILDVNSTIPDIAYRLTVGQWLYDSDEFGNNISAIILSSNESIYPDKTIQIKFDNTQKLLLLRKDNDDNNITHIDYNLIIGITLLKPTTRKSPYSIGKSV